MNRCPKCQELLNENTRFCKNCGAKLAEESSATKGFAMSRTKWMVASASGVVVLGILFFSAQALASKDRALDSFLEAVAERDHAAVKNQLVSSDPELEVEDEHVEAFLEYLDGSNEAHSELISKWIAEAEVMDSARAVSYYDGRFDDFPVSFQHTGNKWLFFDNYQFVLEAQPLNVRSNMNAVSFQLNEEPIEPKEAESDSYYLGDYLPGHYQIKGSVDYEFGSNEQETEINLFTTTSTSLEFTLDLATLEVPALVDGTTLHIEGSEQETEVPSSPLEFGPVLTDGSLTYYIEADTTFGILQSQPAPIESSQLQADLIPNEELKEQLTDILHDYLLSHRVAKQEKDTGELVHASQKIQDDLDSDFEFNSDWQEETFYAGYLLETGMNWDSARMEESHHGWTVRIPTYEKWEEAEYQAGDQPTLDQVERNYQYELTYEEGEWLVTNIETLNYGQEVEPTDTAGFDRDEQDETSSTESTIEEGTKMRLSDDDADSLISLFVRNYVNGVNAGDSSFIDDYVTAEYMKENESYMLDLYDRGIRESFVQAEATNVTENDDDSYTVETEEIYEIRPTDGDATRKTFEATYTVIYNEDENLWQISELIETNETDSEDL